MEYQRLFSASKPTASRELEQLRSMGVLAKVGTTGKGTHYVLAGKGLAKGSKGSSTPKGSQRAHKEPPRQARQEPDKTVTPQSGSKGKITARKRATPRTPSRPGPQKIRKENRR